MCDFSSLPFHCFSLLVAKVNKYRPNWDNKFIMGGRPPMACIVLSYTEQDMTGKGHQWLV